MQRGAGAEHEDHDPDDGTSPIPQPSVVPTNPEPRQYGQTRTLVLAMAGQVIPYVRHIHADIPSEQQNRPPHHATHRRRTLPIPAFGNGRGEHREHAELIGLVGITPPPAPAPTGRTILVRTVHSTGRLQNGTQIRIVIHHHAFPTTFTMPSTGL